MANHLKLAARLLVLLILVLVLSSAALAQASPHFDASWSRLASGGGTRQSSNFRTQDILGQWVSLNPASQQARIVTDFYWEGDNRADEHPVYLPVTLR